MAEDSLERVQIPCVGSKFPLIEAQTTQGTIRLPDHFAGKWFVLFTHPGDFTPVCTTEFASFAKHHEDFRKLNCELVGLSVDQVFSHMKWTEWIRDHLGVRVDYPIIADSMGRLARMLGSIQPPDSTNTLRGLYFVDPKATIRSLLFYPKGIGRNMEEILRIVEAMQVEDKYQVALPANWPSSEFIGDEVLLHPPTEERVASERRGMHGCEDWWFCHRKIAELRKE